MLHRSLLLLSLTLLSTAAPAQTSTYFPFPNDSAYWCSEYCGNMGNGLIEATDVLNGTTQINGQQYSRLQHFQRSCNGGGFCVCAQIVQVDTATYYLRQDIPNKKIWLYDFATNRDTIFLDFDLQVGDTIDARNAYWARDLFPVDPIQVIRIDSLPIAGQYRKRINYLYFGYTNYMVEGIGPAHGLFFPPNSGIDYASALDLFVIQNQPYFPVFATDTTGLGQFCVDFTTGIPTTEQLELFLVYPNPSAGEITIRLDQRITDACFELFSAQGSLVHRASISGPNPSPIRLQHLNAGIYLARLTEGDRSIVRKMVVR